MSISFVYSPPFCFVTLPLGISLVASIFRQKPFQQNVWKKTYWTWIVQLLLFLAIILVAEIGRVDWQKTPFPGANRGGLYTVNAFLLLSVAVATYWVVRMKGARWFAVSAALLQLWLLTGAGFVAGMSLSGTWL